VKIILESTSKVIFLSIDGVDVPARIWEGHTMGGVPCHAFITRIAVRQGEEYDHREFEQDLQEQRAPHDPGILEYPLRMIL
jgi:hypothetical protein